MTLWEAEYDLPPSEGIIFCLVKKIFELFISTNRLKLGRRNGLVGRETSVQNCFSFVCLQSCWKFSETVKKQPWVYLQETELGGSKDINHRYPEVRLQFLMGWELYSALYCVINLGSSFWSTQTCDSDLHRLFISVSSVTTCTKNYMEKCKELPGEIVS